MHLRHYLIFGLLIILGLPLILYATGTFFFVNEMESALVTRFGNVQYAVVSGFDHENESQDHQIQTMKKRAQEKDKVIKFGAGLYFKWPFVERVHKFDSRILHWDGDESQQTLKDRRTLHVDTVAYWRITDPIKFYDRVRTWPDWPEARKLIGSAINSKVKDKLSETLLIEAVRNENLELEEDVRSRLEEDETEERELDVNAASPDYGRKELINKIKNGLEKKLETDFGVQLVDVMFTRLNYTKSVRESVYDRMISERKRIAERKRSLGRKTKREIQGRVSREKDKLLSEADRKVKNILGEAERDRIEIHANAFSKAPDFFRFYRSLEVYRESLGKNTRLLLSDENRLLEFTTDDQLNTPDVSPDNSGAPNNNK